MALLALFEFSPLNSFSVSIIETSLNEELTTFSNFSLISKMMSWILYVLIALTTGSLILELESSIYEFTLIFSVFVAFWKKIFSFSDTKVTSDIMFSSLFSRIIFFANFLFSGKRGWMFFQKALLSTVLLTSNVSKYFLRTFLYNLLQMFLCFLYFS